MAVDNQERSPMPSVTTAFSLAEFRLPSVQEGDASSTSISCGDESRDDRLLGKVSLTGPDLAGFAAALLASRSHRDKYIGRIGEPAFDMLLDLYVQEQERQRGVCITSLGQVSGLPATTALRCIYKLEERGMIMFSGDPDDRRRRQVRLSAQTKQNLDRFLGIAKSILAD